MPYNYARRKELAALRGFADPTGKTNPYTYYRKVTEFANKSEQFTTGVGDGAGVDEEGEEHNLDTARLFYEAFVLGDEDDYNVYTRNGKIIVKYDAHGKPMGAKAKVIVDVLHYVSSAAAFRRLYPTSTRFGHIISVEGKKSRRKYQEATKRTRGKRAKSTKRP